MSDTPTFHPGARDGIARPLSDRVGQGDPTGKYYGQVLTEEEEKRVDEKGERVVYGLPWSRAKTGLYLSLFAPKDPREFTSPYGSTVRLTDKVLLWIDVGVGRVRCPVEGAGLCLELPSDLGQDPLKARYVTEWIIETVKEILGGFRESPWLPEGKQVELVMKIDAAIGKAGL